MPLYFVPDEVYIPRVLRLTPTSGGAVQNPSSDLRHVTIASIALVTAMSIPFSFTKKEFPYFPDRRVQKTFGKANLVPSPTLKFSTFPEE